jgi:hypothetical protein
VLSPESAQALREHYAAAEDSGHGRRLATAILTVLGTLLVGGGVVLLLAHNWDDLSRGARAGLLVSVLVAAQALAAFALLRRFTSLTWRESAGALQVAGVAAAVALVAQTYHVPGDLAGYYRTVLLLTIPLVYLLESATVSVLAWAGRVALSTTASSATPVSSRGGGLPPPTCPFLFLPGEARRRAGAPRSPSSPAWRPAFIGTINAGLQRLGMDCGPCTVWASGHRSMRWARKGRSSGGAACARLPTWD